jgi:hypothetical protein
MNHFTFLTILFSTILLPLLYRELFSFLIMNLKDTHSAGIALGTGGAKQTQNTYIYMPYNLYKPYLISI